MSARRLRITVQVQGSDYRAGCRGCSWESPRKLVNLALAQAEARLHTCSTEVTS